MNLRPCCGLLLLLAAAGGCSSSFTAGDAETTLVFQAVPADSAELSAENLAALKHVVEARIVESRITPTFLVETTPAGELRVFLPRQTADVGSVIQRLVTRPGTLEFAILANTHDHAALIAQAAQDGDVTADGTRWAAVGTGRQGQPFDITSEGDVVTRDVQRDGKPVREFLVVLGEPESRVTDRLLTSAGLEEGTGGNLALRFNLSDEGASLMRSLTGGATPAPDGFRRRLGIILDGTLMSAPYVNDVVGGSGLIEGNFTRDEAEHTVWCLNAGRLPVPLEIVDALDIQSGE